MGDDLLYHSFSLPPKQAIDYLSQKGYALSFNYDELMHEAHHKAFTVAKVTKLDLLSDIHQSLIDALQKGTPFKEWKKNIVPTLVKHGWYGETSVTDPRTGESKDIYVGSRRLKTIFDTNMQVAYSAGRHAEMMGLEDSVYWRYVTRDDKRVRHSHTLLHGMIRHRDDPIWKTSYPPNDWMCRCRVRAYDADTIAQRGWSITDSSTPMPEGYAPHPDWAYDVGAQSRFFDTNKLTPCSGGEENAKKSCLNRSDWKQEGLFDLRNIDIKLHLPSPGILPKADSVEAAHAQAINAILGTEKEIIVKTPMEQVLIDEELLRHFIESDGRERYANFIVPTLTNPLEIWYTRFDDGKIRPQYIALFDAPKAILVSVIVKRDGSLFWNAMESDFRRMNKSRVGEWVWKSYE